MGYEDSKKQLSGSNKDDILSIVADDPDDLVEEDDGKKKKKDGGFLEWLFGWIIDPIVTIIEGIIAVVMFVINAILFFANLGMCSKWYLIYIFGTILYLPITFLVLIFGLKKLEKKIFKVRNKMHDWIVCNTGHNILRYSDEIRKICFFEKIKKRKCPTFTKPGGGFSDIFVGLFDGFSSFNYIAIVTSIATLLFLGSVFVFLVWPVIKGFWKKTMGSSSD